MHRRLYAPKFWRHFQHLMATLLLFLATNSRPARASPKESFGVLATLPAPLSGTSALFSDKLLTSMCTANEMLHYFAALSTPLGDTTALFSDQLVASMCAADEILRTSAILSAPRGGTSAPFSHTFLAIMRHCL